MVIKWMSEEDKSKCATEWILPPPPPPIAFSNSAHKTELHWLYFHSLAQTQPPLIQSSTHPNHHHYLIHTPPSSPIATT
ncbi:hypothetical protein PILCRDRAFT_3342 [Piloderma croceum F 1598]|uniref:Uncharacterized protein n=1 Tax=Piloderma croceum (strain F 1598) TaxID=765440 RepID=A0A0C3CF06_PILCF|nr:hypothetical protein PILCRDRAFT_3342 [Piloderma croceum F 1598]